MATSSRSSACVTTCSLLTPCKRALTRLFRIRAFRFRTLRKAAARMSPARRRHRRRPRRRSFRSVRTVFWPLIPASSRPTPATSLESHTSRRDVAAAEEVIPEAVPVPAPVPSPETPAYEKMVARLRSRTSTSSSTTSVGEEEKEEACQSFESCLMEILMEDGGKVRDLQDVEELLQCWERLKSPVFVDLVCRFYGELCKDVFGVDDGNADGDEASVLSTPAA